MGKMKGIAKGLKGGLKMAGLAAPAVVALFGLSFMCVSCNVVSPQEKFYKSYRETEQFKVVYMADVEEANEAYKAGYITQSEYQKRIDEFDSEAYLKDLIMKDTEHPEYREALEKMDEGWKYLAIGGPTMFIAGIGSAVFYASGAGKDVFKSAKKDFGDAKDEFKKKNPPKSKVAKKVTKSLVNKEEEDIPSIEDDYYKY